MFDAHTHMQDPRFDSCRAAALVAACRAGVSGLCCCATGPADWNAVAALVRDPPPGAPPLLVPAFGVHPWHAANLAAGWEERLDALLLDHRGAALGECGLDGVHADTPRETQRLALVRQLEIAAAHGRPVVVHGARAWGALLDAIRPFVRRLPALIAHSFGGSRDILRAWIGLGGFVSYSGTICNPAATRVRAVASETPADRILVETDSPDLFPRGGIPCPGFPVPAESADRGPNHPANLTTVLAALAALRTVPADELAARADANARRAFAGFRMN